MYLSHSHSWEMGTSGLGDQRLCPYMQRDPALLGQLDQLSPFSLSRTRLQGGNKCQIEVLVSHVAPGGRPCLLACLFLTQPFASTSCLVSVYASPGRGIQRGAPEPDIKALSALLG